MRYAYFDAIMLIERLHRLFLEVVKYKLDLLRIEDINNVQCMILYNIGTGQLSIGELTHRGYYLGSNVSYNLKKMVQSGYIAQEPSPHDRRSSRIKLTAKGIDLYKKLDESLTQQVADLEKEGVTPEEMRALVQNLTRMEAFWEGISLKDMRF